jgi:hypothetical protein
VSEFTLARKREWDKRIIDILEKHGVQSFGEIQKNIQIDFRKEISPERLNQNLIFLHTKKIIEKITSNKEKDETSGEKIIQCISSNQRIELWQLVEPHYKIILRESLVKVMETLEPLEFVTPVPWSEPIFISNKSINDNPPEVKKLFDVSADRFNEEFKLKLYDRTLEEDEEVEGLIAQLLWATHKLQEQFTSPRTISTQNENLEKSSPISDFKELIANYQQHPSLAKISTAIEYRYPEQYYRISPYKWQLLDRTIFNLAVTLDLDQIEDVEKKAQKILDSPNNADTIKTLEKLASIVEGIQYVFMVAVGGQAIDKVEWNLLLQDFNKWLYQLKIGELDSQEFLFNQGQKNLKTYIKLIKKEKKTAKKIIVENEKQKILKQIAQRPIQPPWTMSFIAGKTGKNKAKLQIDQTSWNLAFLYEHHPLGKKSAFYEEIYEAIQVRRKNRRRTRIT